MSRPLRIEYPDAWYHVMNRGRRSEKIFLNKNDYQTFIELLIEASELWTVNISAYCMMPNHYHLLINTPKGNLSRFMRHLNGVYTQRFNKNNKCEGQLFKGRFKSILVDGDSYLLQLLRYIHRNPLQGKLVNDINEFEWSSHLGYLSNSKDWDWLYKDFMLSILSEDKNKWLEEYKGFINQKDQKEILKMFDGKKWPSMYGSDEFIFTVKEEFFFKKRNEEIPESFNLSPTVDRIKEVVCRFYDVDLKSLHGSVRRVQNEPRNMAVFLVRQHCNCTLKQIVKDFLLNKYSAASMILFRTKKEIRGSKRLKSSLQEMEKMLFKC